MRQRVCIARTLVMQPRLILLDEPFGALDQQTRLLMGDELLRLWRETDATVFLITHALDEATMLADRIGVMSARPGRLIDVVETGWPRERDSRIVERAGVRRDHRPPVEDAARGVAEDDRRRRALAQHVKRVDRATGVARSAAASSRCSRCSASPASSTRSRCRRRT